MSHYEERLERDLEIIRGRIRAVASQIGEALKSSVQAVRKRDLDLANKVVLGDLPINREIRDIDKLCHGFVARHLPSAGHLRFVSSVLRLDVELERIGDYAVAIAREAVQLSETPPSSVAHDIDLIADQADKLFRQAVKSFDEGNAELARGTKGMAAQVDATFQKVFSDLIAEGERSSRPIKDLFGLLVIFNRIGRVADQAKNICEETIFAVTGETKKAKVYRILFIDERNDGLSQMAESFARKAFPESGEFRSAGWQPAEGLDPQFQIFAEENGLDTARLEPKRLDSSVEYLNDFHVVVGLQAGTRDRIPEIPFHTVLLEWDFPEVPAELDQERKAALLKEAYMKLSGEIRDLMEIMRGEGAT